MIKEYLLKEPYRVFFPFGFLSFMVGIAIWLPLLWSDEFYPISLHRYLVINGFMYSFIGGVLFTAIPRFSQTDFLNQGEFILYIVASLFGIPLLWYGENDWVYLVTSCQGIVILLFLFKRMFKRKRNPPSSFIFMIGGIVLSIVFGVTRSFDLLPFISSSDFLPITLIIWGIGGRLVPGILGHVEVEKIITTSKWTWLTNLIVLVLIVFSLFLEETLAHLIYFICSLYWGIVFCQLYKFPKRKTSLNWSIWTASWLLILSFLMIFFFADGEIHIIHSLFIGVFFILTFSVATRVVISHGGKNQGLENNKFLFLFLFFAVLAMATRLSIIFLPDLYYSHLAYSALMLLISGGIWGRAYLKQIFLWPVNNGESLEE